MQAIKISPSLFGDAIIDEAHHAVPARPAPAPNPIAPDPALPGEPDERDTIIAQLQARLAAIEARATPAPARRVEPDPLPGELHRERVDDVLLVFCAETYKDMSMVACYQVDETGRRHNKPLYTKSRDKALDSVYRAAVAGVHRLHEEA